MPFSPEDIAELKKLMGEVVTAQLTEGLGPALDARLKQVVDPLKAQLEELKTKAPAGEPPKGKGKGKGADADDDDPTAAELARLRKMVEDREQALAEAEAKAKAEKLHTSARDALVAAGVPADRVPVALAYLRDRLAYGDGDKPGLKGTDRFGTEVVEPLDVAIPKVLGTPEGKLFLPPTGTEGSGTGGGRPAPRTSKGETDWDALASRVSVTSLLNT